MPRFSGKSKGKLNTCHPKLRRIFEEVIKNIDCTIIEGVRSEETQKEYVRKGVSKTMNSKHLEQEDGYSHAVDVICYPIDWNDNPRNYMFAGYVKGIADSMGIKIRLGADWNGNMTAKDQSFHDLPHFELDPSEANNDEFLPDEPTNEQIRNNIMGWE